MLQPLFLYILCIYTLVAWTFTNIQQQGQSYGIAAHHNFTFIVYIYFKRTIQTVECIVKQLHSLFKSTHSFLIVNQKVVCSCLLRSCKQLVQVITIFRKALYLSRAGFFLCCLILKKGGVSHSLVERYPRKLPTKIILLNKKLLWRVYCN